jgi:hypothetical protein
LPGLLFSGDRVLDLAHAGNGDADYASYFHGAHSRRGAGGDKVTGLKSEKLADVGQNSTRRENHVRDGGVLDALAVEPGLDSEGFKFDFVERNGPAAGGAEGVEAFAAGPLAVALLEVAGGDVVDAGVAPDVFAPVFGFDVAGALADDEAEFAFVVEILGELGVDDFIAVGD